MRGDLGVVMAVLYRCIDVLLPRVFSRALPGSGDSRASGISKNRTNSLTPHLYSPFFRLVGGVDGISYRWKYSLPSPPINGARLRLATHSL